MGFGISLCDSCCSTSAPCWTYATGCDNQPYSCTLTVQHARWAAWNGVYEAVPPPPFIIWTDGQRYYYFCDLMTNGVHSGNECDYWTSIDLEEGCGQIGISVRLTPRKRVDGTRPVDIAIKVFALTTDGVDDYAAMIGHRNVEFAWESCNDMYPQQFSIYRSTTRPYKGCGSDYVLCPLEAKHRLLDTDLTVLVEPNV